MFTRLVPVWRLVGLTARLAQSARSGTSRRGQKRGRDRARHLERSRVAATIRSVLVLLVFSERNPIRY